MSHILITAARTRGADLARRLPPFLNPMGETLLRALRLSRDMEAGIWRPILRDSRELAERLAAEAERGMEERA